MKSASIYSGKNEQGAKVMFYRLGNSRAEVEASGATMFRVLKNGVWRIGKSYIAASTIAKVKAALGK